MVDRVGEHFTNGGTVVTTEIAQLDHANAADHDITVRETGAGDAGGASGE